MNQREQLGDRLFRVVVFGAIGFIVYALLRYFSDSELLNSVTTAIIVALSVGIGDTLAGPKLRDPDSKYAELFQHIEKNPALRVLVGERSPVYAGFRALATGIAFALIHWSLTQVFGGGVAGETLSFYGLSIALSFTRGLSLLAHPRTQPWASELRRIIKKTWPMFDRQGLSGKSGVFAMAVGKTVLSWAVKALVVSFIGVLTSPWLAWAFGTVGILIIFFLPEIKRAILNQRTDAA